MATHSSVLAWRIPGTGEPGGLTSMRSHRVGHDWSDLAAAAAAAYSHMGFPGSPDGKEKKVAQLCLTLCNPMDYSLPGSSVHGILQTRVQSGLPFPSPGDLPNPGAKPRSSSLQADSLPTELQGSPDGKESACNSGDLCSIPRSGRSPGGGHGNTLKCSCLENLMDRGAWRATVHGVTKSWTWLSD